MLYRVRILTASGNDLIDWVCVRTGLNRRQARALVVGDGVVADGLLLPAAESLAEQIRGLEERVVVEPAWDTGVLTIDPEQGVDQELVEVFRGGTTLGVRRRRFGEWRSIRSRYFGSVERAEAAFAEQIAGRDAAPSEQAAFERLSSRNRDLEAAIAEAPQDDERWLVYADWLMSRGDVRGEWMQRAIREGQVPEGYVCVMLGPSAPLIEDLSWYRGRALHVALDEARVQDEGTLGRLMDALGVLAPMEISFETSLAEAIGRAQPAFRFAANIDIQPPHPLTPAAVEALRPSLVGLNVSSMENQGDEPFTVRSDRLRFLVASGQGAFGEAFWRSFLAAADLPNVEFLTLALGPMSLDAGCLELELPQLQSVSLDYPVRALGSLMAKPLLRTVARLSLRVRRQRGVVEHLLEGRSCFGEREVTLLARRFPIEWATALRDGGYIVHVVP